MKQLEQNNSVDLKIQELEDQMQAMTSIIEKLVHRISTKPPSQLMKMDTLVQDIEDDEESVSMAHTHKTHQSTVMFHHLNGFKEAAELSRSKTHFKKDSDESQQI